MVKTLINSETDTVRSRKKCLKKFLYYFKKGYHDQKYLSWEREYKEAAHSQFQNLLNKSAFEYLLKLQKFESVAEIAVKIESKTNLLFSFEKMALRDAVKSPEGAKAFAIGLFNYIYSDKSLKSRFESFVTVVEKLPRKQTRVLTWPLITVFGFIANPREHMFLKPTVTKIAAKKFDYPFDYKSKPNWNTYQSLLRFADEVRKETVSYQPKDYIDLQSFIWVIGSEEYPD